MLNGMNFSIGQILFIWFCATIFIYSINIIKCDVGGWDKSLRFIFGAGAITVILLFTVVETILTEFSIVSLLSRLSGFFGGYCLADTLWQKSERYNFDIQEERDN